MLSTQKNDPACAGWLSPEADKWPFVFQLWIRGAHGPAMSPGEVWSWQTPSVNSRGKPRVCYACGDPGHFPRNWTQNSRKSGNGYGEALAPVASPVQH